MPRRNSVDYCSLYDIEDKCPEVKTLWFRNERYRQALAKRNGASLRLSFDGNQTDLRSGYMEELLTLVEMGILAPRHVKYLTGITHAAYIMRTKRLGYGADKRYKHLDKQIHKHKYKKMGITTKD